MWTTVLVPSFSWLSAPPLSLACARKTKATRSVHRLLPCGRQVTTRRLWHVIGMRDNSAAPCLEEFRRCSIPPYSTTALSRVVTARFLCPEILRRPSPAATQLVALLGSRQQLVAASNNVIALVPQILSVYVPRVLCCRAFEVYLGCAGVPAVGTLAIEYTTIRMWPCPCCQHDCGSQAPLRLYLGMKTVVKVLMSFTQSLTLAPNPACRKTCSKSAAQVLFAWERAIQRVWLLCLDTFFTDEPQTTICPRSGNGAVCIGPIRPMEFWSPLGFGVRISSGKLTAPIGTASWGATGQVYLAMLLCRSFSQRSIETRFIINAAAPLPSR